MKRNTENNKLSYTTRQGPFEPPSACLFCVALVINVLNGYTVCSHCFIGVIWPPCVIYIAPKLDGPMEPCDQTNYQNSNSQRQTQAITTAVHGCTMHRKIRRDKGQPQQQKNIYVYIYVHIHIHTPQEAKWTSVNQY